MADIEIVDEGAITDVIVFGQQVTELPRKLANEFKRLQAIDAALPKSLDNYTLVPGVPLFYPYVNRVGQHMDEWFVGTDLHLTSSKPDTAPRQYCYYAVRANAEAQLVVLQAEHDKRMAEARRRVEAVKAESHAWEDHEIHWEDHEIHDE